MLLWKLDEGNEGSSILFVLVPIKKGATLCVKLGFFRPHQQKPAFVPQCTSQKAVSANFELATKMNSTDATVL